MIKFGVVYGILKPSFMTAGLNKVSSRSPKNTYRRIHPTDMIYFAVPARVDGNELLRSKLRGILKKQLVFQWPVYADMYGNERFVAVGAYSTIVTSPDSLNWSTVRSGSKSWLGEVVHARKTFMVIGADGTTLASPDGTIWLPIL
jgi:hypothetical protein